MKRIKCGNVARMCNSHTHTHPHTHTHTHTCTNTHIHTFSNEEWSKIPCLSNEHNGISYRQATAHYDYSG